MSHKKEPKTIGVVTKVDHVAKTITIGPPPDPKPTRPDPKLVLSDEHRAILRASTADQMAEIEAINAAAEHATRNIPREKASVGARLSSPIVITPEQMSATCHTCGWPLAPGATCIVDGTVQS